MNWHEKIAQNRTPDLAVENNGEIYLERWHLIPQNWFFNIYLHRFTNSDLPVPHDHPWFSLAYIIKGSFIEHRPGKKPRHCFERGFYFRSPFSLHWLEMIRDVTWTIFFTGPVIKPWGFVENGKWIYNKRFLVNRKSRGKVESPGSL